VIVPKLQLPRQFVYRIQRSSPRAIAIATGQEVLLVDGFQQTGDCHLPPLVLYGGHAEGTPLAIAFREVGAFNEFSSVPLLLAARY
jgi:hypothetical protein